MPKLFSNILLILFAIGHTAIAQPQRNLNFYHLGSKAGLSQVTINGLYQDENGMLWIGTKEGVKYYDGNKVESLNLHGLNNWISSSFVPTVTGDGQGHIFINTDFNIVEYDLRRNTSKILFSQSNTSTPPAIAFRYGRGALWIGRQDSLFVYRAGDTVRYYATLRGQGCEIASLHPSDGKIYVGTKNDGLICIDSLRNQRHLLDRCSEIISLFEDAEGDLWCGTFDDGIYHIDSRGHTTNLRKTTSENSLSSNYIRAFGQDTQGNLWVGTSSGLNIIDYRTGTVSRYGLSENGKKGLSNLSIWAIIRDRQGTMWLGTYYGGLDYCNFDSERFEHHDFGFNAGNGYSVISAIAEDKRGDLWLGTESNGLLFVDGRTNAYTFCNNAPVSHYNIKSLHYDPQNDMLWIGTHQGGLYRYDIARKSYRSYTVNPADKTTRSESLLDIEAYSNGLFIGTLLGVYYLNFSDDTITPIDELRQHIFEANRILVSSRGEVWVAGNKLCRYNPVTGTVREFYSELQPFTQGSKLTTTSLLEDSDGNICIGTAGSGLLVFDPDAETFRQYSKANCNLSDDYVSSIFQADDGNMLVGTDTGLSYLDKNRMRSYVFNADNGFPLHSMQPGCIYRKSGSDAIILGGINGMAVTSQARILSEGQPFRLFLSELYVNNKPVRAGDATGILSEAFQFTKRISLKYSQNNIAVEFGNNNLASLGQPHYQYRLEGFDKDWIVYTPRMPVRYTNLPYGKYTLHTRTDLPSRGEGEEIALAITVRPPLYATWYAYVFYVVFIAGMIVWTVYFYRSRLLLRTSLEIERRNKEHIEKANEQKLRFFGNISHELRTPLTLILGQLELLLMSGRLTDDMHRKVAGIYNDSQKMKSLINELLDIMKFDQGEFRLKVSRHDIVGFVSGLHGSFSALAELKQVELSFSTQVAEQWIWFDEVQMQKVFNNLLSNAFKYTPRGGKIAIGIEPEKDGFIAIRVRDTGIGIPEKMQEKIFERFFQVDNQINHDIAQTGTGIGLSLTQHIVRAHRGQIGVESLKGAGSTFTVRLCCDDHLFDKIPDVDVDHQQTAAPDITEIGPENQKFLEELSIRQQEDSRQAASILIVEDDAVLRKMLMQIFEPIFDIFEAANGEEGFAMAVKHAPDLILSDVMMPVMAGDEFCRRIKNNFDTCHIPVILLTALDSVEHNLRGLNCGADDYITKPFDIRLLVTRCVGVVNNRRLMQQKFNGHEQNAPQMIATNRIDEEFIGKVIRLIEENVILDGVNVTLLCSQMAMSRTKLFNKIKGITGQSPHDFIQSVKLKVAARMLRENSDANISDIAYTLGFSSLNYFGKCFRSAFGVSPSVYRKSTE